MAEVRLEVDLPHPPERIWRALTEPRLLAEWFMDADLEACEGTSFTLAPTGLRGFSGPISGELMELAAPRRMVMLWQGEKLHTRVTWELTEIVGGSKLRVLQTGFIGAPATLRRRELRGTYIQLFAERLPRALDRLAAGEVDLGGTAVASLRTAVPRQRRARGNSPDRSWRTGRSRWGQSAPPRAPGAAGAATAGGTTVAQEAVAGEVAATEDETPPGGAPSPGGAVPPGNTGPPGVPGPRRPAGEEAIDSASAGQSVRSRRQRRRWLPALPAMRTWLAVAPAWARFVAVGATACVLAIAVLATLTRVGDDGTGGPPTTEGERGPGTAVQPGTGGEPGPAPEPTSGSPTPRTGGPQTGTSPEPSPDDESPGDSSTGDASTEGTGGPEPPELTARLATSGLGLLTGKTGTVTLSNPGSADAAAWVVTVNVGDQPLGAVEGAAHERDGDTVTFTPHDPGEPGAEADLEFTFRLPGGLLGLQYREPTDCTIEGRPCES